MPMSLLLYLPPLIGCLESTERPVYGRFHKSLFFHRNSLRVRFGTDSTMTPTSATISEKPRTTPARCGRPKPNFTPEVMSIKLFGLAATTPNAMKPARTSRCTCKAEAPSIRPRRRWSSPGPRSVAFLRGGRPSGSLLVLSGCRGVLLGLLVGEMAADNAAADGPEHGVMAGVVAGDAADERSLEAALGRSGRGRRRHAERDSECGGNENCAIHLRAPCCAAALGPYSDRLNQPWRSPGLCGPPPPFGALGRARKGAASRSRHNFSAVMSPALRVIEPLDPGRIAAKLSTTRTTLSHPRRDRPDDDDSRSPSGHPPS